MTADPFSIADATSDGVVKRLEEAVAAECTRLSSERLARVRGANELIAGLSKRGLLKRQEFGSATSADLEKRYCAARKR
jgi:hypothetical protein